MKTNRMLALLAFTLLAGVGAEVTFHVEHHWSGGFEVKAQVPICQDLHGWKIHVTFSQDVASLDIWMSTATKVSAREYILTNLQWNGEQHTGDMLDVTFNAHTSGDISPDVGLSVEGQSDCVPITTTTDVPGQTHPTTPHVTHAVLPLNVTGTKQRIRVKGNYLIIGENDERFFLSGANTAWVAYGYDFGTGGQYQYRRTRYLELMDKVRDAGGNSMRTWVHIEGAVSPAFDANGFVTGLDTDDTFISDFRRYLDDAQERNILIFPCLWNGAVRQNFHPRLQGLIRNADKLQSYLDNALTPWVKAVKDHPALGGWDIINELEGFIKPGITDPEPCFDTNFLRNSGAGWAGDIYSAKELLLWINWQVDAIRRADPDALVTAGSSSQRAQTDNTAWNDKNLYSDECLTKAGGREKGTLTFYSTHSYDWQGKFAQDAVFLHSAADYNLDKPVVVAEFNSIHGAGMTIEQMFNYVYTHGYAGAWSWHAMADGSDTDTTENQMKGIASIRTLNDQTAGGRIALNLNR